jgi:hypothetical protein
MTTPHEYRQFARQCTKWATETETDDARNAFLDLACDWTFAALCLDRGDKEDSQRLSRLRFWHWYWRVKERIA